jgi:hypothetical protein
MFDAMASVVAGNQVMQLELRFTLVRRLIPAPLGSRSTKQGRTEYYANHSSPGTFEAPGLAV